MDWTSVVLIIISSILSVVTVFFGFQWAKIKVKIEQFKVFVVLVADATTDNKVTEQEFKGIVEAAKRLLNMS